MDLPALKPLGCALLLSVTMLSASAQQNVLLPPSGQNPLISNPDVDAVQRANAFMPHQSNLQIFNAAKPGPSFDILPGSTPNYNSPEQTKAWEKFLESKKNWTLMTPEEILGVPTPEKILGVQDPDDVANLSPEERFLKRLGEKEHANTPTNSTRPINFSFQSEDSNPFLHHTENVFRPGNDPDNNHTPGQGKDPYDNGTHRVWGNGIFQNPTLELEAQRATQSNPLWNSPFAQPPETEPDPQQAASMERFRALLNPEPTPVPVALTPNQPILHRVDPNMEVLPVFNPAGNSFTHLPTVTLDRPTGLMPLPGPEARRPQAPPLKPVWTPKLPPWMSKEQNPQAPPERVF